MEKKIKLRFDIGDNLEEGLHDVVAKYDIVNWIYGKMKTDVIGGGRPAMTIKECSWEYFEDRVKNWQNQGIKYNYLLNPLCLGNMEYEQKYHKQYLELFDKISEIGVDGVTVSSPYLCELLKKQYPHFDVSISIYSGVRTLQQIRHWQELGADEITLHLNINRDFPTLKTFLNYTKNQGPRLRLFATNNACLYSCPFYYAHAVSHSHASKTGTYSSKGNLDYNFLRCSKLKMTNPAKLISAMWIRPEDIKYYEDLCNEVGNDKLSIKLGERTANVGYFETMLKAYSERSYDGNLYDLLSVGKTSQYNHLDLDHYYKRIEENEWNQETMKFYPGVMDFDWIHIDNKKLDGYLKKYVNNYNCNEKICDDKGWLGVDKEEWIEGSGVKCSYCKKWSEKVITFDEEKRQQFLKHVSILVDDLQSSKMFFADKCQ